jgi:cytochrome c oxidase subunit 2
VASCRARRHGLSAGATELARDIHWLDGLILVIITAIVLFVTALLAW